MFERIRVNFTKGIGRIKWFAAVFSERLKIEIGVIKLMYKSDEMNQKKEELFRTIGRRVYEFREHPDKNILRDRTVSEAIDEIARTEKDIAELQRKASELSRAGI